MDKAQPTVVGGPHFRLALVLGVAAMFATLAVFPYVMALMPLKMAAIPVPTWIVVLAQSLQSGVICWLLAWLGLSAGAKYGLDAPWLRAKLYHLPAPVIRSAWWLAATAGLLSGVAVVLIDAWLHHGGLHGGSAAGAVWRGALASFYGGIAEEIISRLGVMSVLVWLLAALAGHRAKPWVFVTAIVIAALLFGAGHLPAAFASGMQASVASIGRILALNGLVGVVCGVLYWRKGLEHAMVAHFCADLVLHVATPALA